MTILHYIIIAHCVLTLISIIVSLCLWRTLLSLKKATTPQSITQTISGAINNLSGAASTLLKALKLDGLGDAVGLIKDIITPTGEGGATSTPQILDNSAEVEK